MWSKSDPLGKDIYIIKIFCIISFIIVATIIMCGGLNVNWYSKETPINIVSDTIQYDKGFKEGHSFAIYTLSEILLRIDNNAKKDTIKEHIKSINTTISDEELNTIIDSIFKANEKFGLDIFEILTIIDLESKGNPKSLNKKSKTIGLMQIAPINFKGLQRAFSKLEKFEDLYDIDINIMCGSYLLWSKLNNANGNMSKALKSYSGNTVGYENKFNILLLLINKRYRKNYAKHAKIHFQDIAKRFGGVYNVEAYSTQKSKWDFGWDFKHQFF